jgi:hypothetical protein
MYKVEIKYNEKAPEAHKTYKNITKVLKTFDNCFMYLELTTDKQFIEIIVPLAYISEVVITREL